MTWRALNPWSELGVSPGTAGSSRWPRWSTAPGPWCCPFLALHLTQNLKLSAGQAGAALAVYGAVSLVISPIAGRLADRVGHQRIISSSLLLGGLGMWVFPLLHTLPQVLGGMAVLSAVAESMRPATLALVSDLAPPELRRQAFALNRLAINLGMSVGPAVGGFLAAHSFATLFWVDGATSIAAGILLLAYPLRPREHGEAATPVRLGAIADPGCASRHPLRAPGDPGLLPARGALPVWMVRELGFSTKDFGLLFTVNTCSSSPSLCA